MAKNFKEIPTMLLKRLANTNMSQRRLAGTVAGGITGAASTPTKENGTNTENFARKAVGGISGAVLGNQAGKFLTNKNISRASAKAADAAQKAHTKIMDSKANDKVKNFGGKIFNKASRDASKVNKAFEVKPSTITPVNTVADAVDVNFRTIGSKKNHGGIKFLPPGKGTTASEFIDYMFEKVASEDINNQEIIFKKKA